MFVVGVFLRQSPTIMQFMFDERTRASDFKSAIQAARRKTETEEAVPEDAWLLGLADDYGQELDVLVEEIGAVNLCDDVRRSVQ